MALVRSIWNRTVVIAALGYFVDIYDLVLFSIVRRQSLLGIGIDEAALLDTGVLLLNWQMAGLLLGGLLWGVLGDKRGRVTVLFGSILMYSLANIANAFVVPISDMSGGVLGVVPVYAGLRFIAGIGLAGELGAAITLVSEVMDKDTRGYGAAVVASLGILGGIVAATVAGVFDWQMAYIVGGVLGLVLLVGRIKMRDSGIFDKAVSSKARRGDLRVLFSSRQTFSKYAWSLLVGLPIWYVVGVLITFSPELAVALGVTGAISAGTAIVACYVGLTTGDLASGVISGLVRSRRIVLVAFLGGTSLLVTAYVFAAGVTPMVFYTICGLLGLGIGFWAVFLTNASEQFGTDIRATVTTTAPNFVRGMTIPITLSFSLLVDVIGIRMAALVVGQVTILIALFAVSRLPETYGKDLDYMEADARDAAGSPSATGITGSIEGPGTHVNASAIVDV